MRRVMKTMILTWGSANRGKSQSLKELASLLSRSFSSAIQNWQDDDYDSYVIGGILDNDGKERRVGVVSLGDPGSGHMTWVDDCVEKNCEVIVAACRRLRQSGRTPWRAASLRGERKALWRDSDTVPVAGISYEVILFPQVWMFYSLT